MPPSKNLGGWWVSGDWDQETLFHWLDPGHMKCWVHSQGPGKPEMHSHRVDHPGDRERTPKARSQLAGFHYRGKVLGGQPHFLPRSMGRGRSLPVVPVVPAVLAVLAVPAVLLVPGQTSKQDKRPDGPHIRYGDSDGWGPGLKGLWPLPPGLDTVAAGNCRNTGKGNLGEQQNEPSQKIYPPLSGWSGYLLRGSTL